MDAQLIDQLIALTRQAGDAILEVYQTEFEVEAKSDDSPLTEADRRSHAVIDAALAGQLTPDALRDLLSALANQARLVEFTEFEDRLAALERQEHVTPWAERSEDRFPLRRKKRRALK